MATAQETAETIRSTSSKLKRVSELLAGLPIGPHNTIEITRVHREAIVALIDETAKLFEELAEVMAKL